MSSRFILVDGDELAYKSSCPKTTWQDGWTLFKTKTHAKANGATEEGLAKNYNNPHPRSVTMQLDSMLRKIKHRCEEQFIDEKNFIVVPVVSGSDNYRKDADATYKLNRADREKPFFLEMAKKHLKTKHQAQQSVGEEADDMLGTLSDKVNDIIASSDKDFLTIPGNLYNIMHDKFTFITQEDSWRNFYMQIMIGDVADNVKGLPNVGPVKARKILENAHTKQDMLRLVIEAFTSKGLSEGDVARTGFLLYIRHNVGEEWSISKVMAGEI